MAVFSTFIFGVSVMIFQLLVSLKVIALSGGILGFVFQNSLYSGVFAMMGGMVIVPIVSLFTTKSIPENVDEKFAGYDKQVTVSAKEDLGNS